MAVRTTHDAVSYDELAERVRAELDRGYQPTRAGRRRLLDLVVELRDAAPAASAGLLEERRWRISSVAVAGIGGIGALDPPVLDLTPTAGLTVIRGQNGHGKTSLARALESALRGERHHADDVTGDLWSAQLLSEGAPRAEVDLVLVGDGARLDVRVTFGAPEDHVSATLTDGDGARPVVIDGAWREALLGSRACYSYSVLQTRLKSDRDLQGYLEELLVLGPVWQSVRTALTTRAETATSAKRAMARAAADARAGETALQERFAADPRGPAPPAAIRWPSSYADDVDGWLVANALTVTGDPGAVAVSDQHERQVDRIRAALRTAEAELAEAEAMLDDPRHGGVLDQLQALVDAPDLGDEHCPACGTTVAWRQHARVVLEGARRWRGAAASVDRALTDLATWVDRVLLPLVDVADGGPRAEVDAFRAAVTAGGARARSAAHRAADVLIGALGDAAHRDWVAALRRSSDASAEWRRERARLVEPFVAAWRGHGAAAEDADAWKVAEKTLDDLQVRLRQERQDGVTAQLHAALRGMLADADVEIADIRHQGGARQKRGAEVTLTLAGRRATLGMLSSGQRNALLLAPLLVLGAAGAFGFLLVDDPVHALDDLRVDHLARELVRLADTYQVVVLTHDPRLEEHLRARRSDLVTITLERDGATGTVTWKRHGTPWDTLLQDATSVRATARRDGWLNDASTESVVAGLCRAALDGAVRQAAINRAVRYGTDVDVALRDLDEQRETRERVDYLLGLAEQPDAFSTTRLCVTACLPAWNVGAHGGDPVGLDLKAQIRTARRACAELVGHRW